MNAAAHTPDFELDHVGVAVADMEKAIAWYGNVFGYKLLDGPTEDPVQKVSVAFLSIGGEKREVIELVCPLHEGSPVDKAIKQGKHLYHMCYRTARIDEAIETLRANGYLLIARPVPAVAFEGRRIAWLYSPTAPLVELVEK